MKKINLLLIISIFSILKIFAKGDDNWFMAQTKSAPLSSITATSELIEAQYEGKYIYPPVNIVDGKFENTWCESIEDGPGIGEAITIEFTEPVSFDEIQIVNGFATKDYYKKNNRVKEIQITQVAKKHFQQKTYTLKDDSPDWQSIKFDYTQTAQTITLKIISVYKGTKYDDTCLDDFRLLYKGKVIPFKNVEEIKKSQEENSKLMLKSDSKDFYKQFTNLFTGSKNDQNHKILLLKSDDDYNCLYMSGYYKSNGTFVLTYITNAYYFKNNTDYMDVFKKIGGIPQSEEEYKDNQKNGLNNIFYESKDPWFNTEYSIGNYRIIQTESVDYVETTTSSLIKLDGSKSIYINGIHYTVLSPDSLNIFNTSEW